MYRIENGRQSLEQFTGSNRGDYDATTNHGGGDGCLPRRVWDQGDGSGADTYLFQSVASCHQYANDPLRYSGANPQSGSEQFTELCAGHCGSDGLHEHPSVAHAGK